MSSPAATQLLKLVEQLSYNERLTLQERIIQRLRQNPPVAPSTRPPLQLNSYPWTNWPPEATFRREDIY